MKSYIMSALFIASITMHNLLAMEPLKFSFEDGEGVVFEAPTAEDMDFFSRIFNAEKNALENPDIVSIDKPNFDELIEKLKELDSQGEKLALAIGRTNEQLPHSKEYTWVHLDSSIKVHTENQLYFRADFNTQRALLERLPSVFSMIAFDVRVVRYIQEKTIEDLIGIFAQKLKDEKSLFQVELSCFYMYTSVDVDGHEIEGHYPYRVNLSKKIINSLSDKRYNIADFSERVDEFFNIYSLTGKSLEDCATMVFEEEEYSKLSSQREALGRNFLTTLFGEVEYRENSPYYYYTDDTYLSDFFLCTGKKSQHE